MKTHIVKEGDTLWKIAKHYGVNFEVLKKSNKQLTNPDMLLPGQEITVPVSGIIKLVEDDDNHKKVMMKPSPVFAESGMNSLKGLIKEVPIQQPSGGMNKKEHVIHQGHMPKEVPIPLAMPVEEIHKEVPVPLVMPGPVLHKEVPIPHTIPQQQIIKKEVPIPHTMPQQIIKKEVPIPQKVIHKEMPMPKKVPVHKKPPIHHIHKEHKIHHIEPHFNFTLPTKKEAPHHIKNDIHPEVDIHNNYYLTNMQMIEHEHKPPKKEVHHYVPKQEVLPEVPKQELLHEVPKQEVLPEVPKQELLATPVPIVQNECVPVAYEEYYIEPGCLPLYDAGLESEMMLMMQGKYNQLPQYGLNNYVNMMNPEYMNMYQGWESDSYMLNQLQQDWIPNPQMQNQLQQNYFTNPYMHSQLQQPCISNPFMHSQLQQSYIPSPLMHSQLQQSYIPNPDIHNQLQQSYLQNPYMNDQLHQSYVPNPYMNDQLQQSHLQNQHMSNQLQQSYVPNPYMSNQLQKGCIPQTQHPYLQQESVPVMAKPCGCGCNSHHSNQQMSNPQLGNPQMANPQLGNPQLGNQQQMLPY